MAIDLERIRARLEQNGGGGGKGDSIWFRPEKPKAAGETNKYEVRILPDADGDPFWDFHMHYGLMFSENNRPTRAGFLCPRGNYNEDCEVCRFGFELYNEAAEEGDDEAKKMARDTFLPSQRFYTVVVERGKEEEGPKIWSFSYTVYKTLLEFIQNPDYLDITDPKTGRDITITTSKDKNKMFHDTSVIPRIKSSPLHKDAKVVKNLLENIPNVEDQFMRKTSDETKGILAKYLDSQKGADDSSTETQKYGGNAENDIENAYKELQND